METNVQSPPVTSIDKSAVAKLSAIAHEGRLSLLRKLIQAGPKGMAAGKLAAYANIAAPTASAQLLILANSELVYSTRVGRQIVYYANYATMSELLTFLVEDCCCGQNDICAPLRSALK